jgi:inorganic pyrophosphatase
MAWSEVPIGDRALEIVNAVVEIPTGSSSKYEYDEALGIIRLKDLEDKHVTVTGWLGREEAHRVISEAQARFQREALGR